MNFFYKSVFQWISFTFHTNKMTREDHLKWQSKEKCKTLTSDTNNFTKCFENEKPLFELEAEENRNKIVSNFKAYSENPESINMQQMWKIMKRLWPKSGSALPVAKKNHRGKIVSGPKDFKKSPGTRV